MEPTEYPLEKSSVAWGSVVAVLLFLPPTPPFNAGKNPVIDVVRDI
jgi:hypothetical protein